LRRTSLSLSICQVDTYRSSKYSILVYGAQNGLLSLHIRESCGIEREERIHLDGPISVVRIFGTRSVQSERAHPSLGLLPSQDDDTALNLLVAGAVGYALVYCSIECHGLGRWQYLENSDRYDSVLCGQAVDVDCDGYNEILLGTYGQELLAYKFYPQAPSEQILVVPLSNEEADGEWTDCHYRFAWNRSCGEPIYHIALLDITGDGLKELSVTTTNYCHFSQMDINMARFHVLRRLSMVEEVRRLNRELAG